MDKFYLESSRQLEIRINANTKITQEIKIAKITNLQTSMGILLIASGHR